MRLSDAIDDLNDTIINGIINGHPETIVDAAMDNFERALVDAINSGELSSDEVNQLLKAMMDAVE